MLGAIYVLQEMTGQSGQNEWMETNRKVERKEEEGKI